MKRLLAIGALLVAPVGCVSNQGDALIRFLENRTTRFESGTCTPIQNTSLTAGALDLAGGGSYLLALAVETNTNQRDLTIGQEVFSGEGLSDIVLTELVYTYQLSDTSLGITLPAEEIVPIYVVFRPQTDPEQTTMQMYSMGPGAIDALQKFYFPKPAYPATAAVTVLSTIKARGYLSASQKTESNVFRFPTTVFASSFKDGGCPAAAPIPVARCGSPGQDGAVSCTSGT